MAMEDSLLGSGLKKRIALNCTNAMQRNNILIILNYFNLLTALLSTYYNSKTTGMSVVRFLGCGEHAGSHLCSNCAVICWVNIVPCCTPRNSPLHPSLNIAESAARWKKTSRLLSVTCSESWEVSWLWILCRRGMGCPCCYEPAPLTMNC